MKQRGYLSAIFAANFAVCILSAIAVAQYVNSPLNNVLSTVPGVIRPGSVQLPVDGDSLQLNWTNFGETSSSFYGYCVSDAGDVNNDGFGDFLVGAHRQGSSRGKAYLYLGRASGPSTIAGWAVNGEVSGSNFAFSISGAGDVNGDGYDDIIVGASGMFSNTGKVYLYYGGPFGPGDTASWTFTGESAGSYLGPVSKAGDVNNDGYDDVIIGSNGWQSFRGKAYLFLGGAAGLSSAPAWTSAGESQGNYFATVVANAGDVNNDNFDDVLISTDPVNGNLGKVYVYHGRAGGLSLLPDWTSSGNLSSHYGYSASGSVDVNNDGYGDIMVGAPGSDSGKVYFHYGSISGLSVLPNAILRGPSQEAYFGSSVTGAGDLNNDGIQDAAIGAINTNGVYCYLGSSTGISPAYSAFRNSSSGSRFGASVSGAGDVNGDGYDDLLAGGYFYQSGRGVVQLFLGSACVLKSTVTWSYAGLNYEERYGFYLSTAGDVNNDGYDDAVISGYAAAEGRVDFFKGSSCGLSISPDWRKAGETWGSNFGATVSGGGDINGDGYDDILIGSSGYSGNKGRAYVYYGTQNGPAGSPGWTTTGQQANDYLGVVSFAGDVNNDGFHDVLVGANGFNSFTGRAYLYLGADSGLRTVPAWFTTGEAIGNYYASWLSPAGDVNNDGYDDVIVATNDIDGNLGKVYVYHGGPAGLSLTPNWTGRNNIQNSHYGHRAAAAGDVNNDGFDDIVVTAFGYQNERGIAYAYYGSPNGLSPVPNWSVTGEAPATNFGQSVSSLGDVNNDGYSDIVISADTYSQQSGKLYVFIGTASGLRTTAGYTIQGPSNFIRYGNSLDARLDANGDGRNDVLVGAFQENGTTGRAFLAGIPSIPVGINGTAGQMPLSFRLDQNFPNPFNPSTKIRFDLVKRSFVKLEVYDATGKAVSTILSSELQPGEHFAEFRGSNLPSGIYYCRIEIENASSSIKMILLK